MAVVGTSPAKQLQESLRNYETDPMRGLAKKFASIAQAGISENVDLFSEPTKFFSKSTIH